MKRIIDGVTYNSDTSTILARDKRHDSGINAEVETILYQTRLGAYFLDTTTTGYHRESYEDIYVWVRSEPIHEVRPLTPVEAQNWIMESGADIYENPFGDPPEAALEEQPSTTVYLRIPGALKQRIEAAAKTSGQSLNAWATRCLERCAEPIPVADFLVRQLSGNEVGITVQSERAQIARGLGLGMTLGFKSIGEARPYIKAAEAEGLTFDGKEIVFR
jgi:hypothetical protein